MASRVGAGVRFWRGFLNRKAIGVALGISIGVGIGFGAYILSRSQVFAFAPSSGTGLPSIASDFCTQYAAEIEGPTSFCYRGDGGFLATQVDGGPTLALTLSGTPLPVVETKVVCPNGPSCATATDQRWGLAASTTGDAEYASAGEATTAGDFSWCALVSRDAVINTSDFIGQDHGTDRGWLVDWGAAASPSWYVFNAAGANTAVTLPGTATKARHLLCGTYDSVADTTSIMRVYMDGTAGNTSSSAKLLNQTGTKKTFLGGYAPAGNLMFNGTLGPSFVTEKILSATTIAAMARSLLADTPTGTRGEAMTFTRASAMVCPGDTDAEVTTVPTDRPCITRDGVYSEPAATNILLRSEEFATTWAETHNTGSSVAITSNSTDLAAPDGTKTAEKMVFSAVTGAGNYNRLYQNFTATAVPYTMSVWLRTLAGTAEVNIGFEDGSAVVTGSTRCTVTTTWTRCTVPNITLTVSANWFAIIGTNLIAGTTMTDTIALTVYVWGAQVETGTFASSYIATLGSTDTRAVTATSFVKPSAFSDNAGCIGATLTTDGIGDSNGRWVAFNGNTSSLYTVSSTRIDAHDGANTAIASGLSSIIGRAVVAVQKWSGVIQTLTADGTTVTATYDGSLSADSFYLGSYQSAALARPNGVIKDVRMSTNPAGCQ